MLSDSVCLSVSFLYKGYPLESGRMVAVKNHFCGYCITHIWSLPHVPRGYYVCVWACMFVWVGKFISMCECVCACVNRAGGGPCIGNVYTNQQTFPQPWDLGSCPSLSHIVYKVKETLRQKLLSCSLIYSPTQELAAQPLRKQEGQE